MHVILLLQRLNEIAGAVSARPHGLALLGLGSVGRERERLDEWSDLDFFVLVEPGTKAHWLDDLTWLTDLAPVTFAFRNTRDGYKLLFDDGVLCEFAVFEPQEMPSITFAPGKVVWARADVDPALLDPAPGQDGSPSADSGSEADPGAAGEAIDMAWEVGEALTNLWVGLVRFHRGERLSAARFVQGHAVDRVLRIAAHLGPTSDVVADPFSPERRAEGRLPGLAPLLPSLVQGYDRTPESARAVLDFLDAYVEVPDGMRDALQRLCERPTTVQR